MTYLILVNPNSGEGKGEKTAKLLKEYLIEQKIEHHFHFTDRIGQEPELMRQILNDKTEDDRILIVGGDGTVSIAINALPFHMPFSYIPSGSGNDFARSLGISLDPIKAFEQLQSQAEKKTIYILKYDSKSFAGYALNNIGIGLDASIVKATNTGKTKALFNKLKLGSLSYLFSALHVLFTKKPFAVSVDSDQSHTFFDKAFLLTFTKHPFFGGGIRIAPEASNLNESIDMVEVERHPLPRIFAVVPKLLKATHIDDAMVNHQRSLSYTVMPNEAQPVQIDGEYFEIQANDTLQIDAEKRTIIC